MVGKRQFDEDVTIDRAVEVFWRQGYAATSIDAAFPACQKASWSSRWRAFCGKADGALVVRACAVIIRGKGLGMSQDHARPAAGHLIWSRG